MPLLELRILPPLAVARLGGAAEPLEAFDLESDPDSPLNYRRIVPRESFEIDPLNGRIVRAYVPEKIRFKDDDKLVRPVAPFLEVYARTSTEPEQLQPLTPALLAEHGLTLANLHWDIELLENTPNVAIVLMDVMMPEMDGYQTMQEIRARPGFRRLPIVALTAKAMKGDRERCLDAGASDYLAKPVNTEQLLSALRLWLHR